MSVIKTTVLNMCGLHCKLIFYSDEQKKQLGLSVIEMASEAFITQMKILSLDDIADSKTSLDTICEETTEYLRVCAESVLLQSGVLRTDAVQALHDFIEREF